MKSIIGLERPHRDFYLYLRTYFYFDYQVLQNREIRTTMRPVFNLWSFQ